MAKHWDALVLGDYEAVMPLTWNKKWNISYLYQPPFTASLASFGKLLTEEIVRAFIAAIPVHLQADRDQPELHGNISCLLLLGFLRNNYIVPSLKAMMKTLYKDTV